MKVKNNRRSKFSNLSDWKEEARKNQGFNRIQTYDLHDTSAMLYQLSYEATQWERGQFVEFTFSRAVKWWKHTWNNSLHIWTQQIDFAPVVSPLIRSTTALIRTDFCGQFMTGLTGIHRIITSGFAGGLAIG